MKWTVVYQPSAQRELTDLWLSASDKQAVTNASNAIDQLLARDPAAAGESREGGMRLVIEAPVAVLFDVHPDDLIVEVWQVREWR